MPKANITALDPVSNDAAAIIELSVPYMAEIVVEGTAPFLFHRWSVESIDAKSKAAKGSKAKKEDDLESYVYRNPAGDLCIPSEYFRMSIINAAKFRQDPRSPRKSAMDLFKAAIATLEPYCSLGYSKWDYVDQRRVMIQRNGITRSRPAINVGWKVSVPLLILLPEYVPPSMLNEVAQSAGRLIGVGDNRPSYGRFAVTNFSVIAEA